MKKLAGVMLAGTFLVGTAYATEKTHPMTMEHKAMVKILSPKEKESLTGKVKIKWELHKGGKVEHVHLYLDGKLMGPQMADWKELKDLKKGSHTVKLVGATSSHQEMSDVSASVTFMVK